MPRSRNDVIAEVFGRMIMSRHEAADTLRTVADEGQYGLFPHDVSCEAFARAVFRLVINAHEERPADAFIAAFLAVQREFATTIGDG